MRIALVLFMCYPTLPRIGYNESTLRRPYRTTNEDAMSTKKNDRVACIRELRDAKAIPYLRQYAPVWLVDETPLPAQDAVRFDVVFYHPRYGWMRQRYTFDAFNNTLYHKGQMPLSEAEMLEIEAQEPYISAEVVNMVGA